MPLLDRFEFLKMGFDIAYHASREPQRLYIEVTTLERNDKRSAPMILKRVLELINAGAGCGSMFAPGESFAERVSGPWDGADAFGPDYRWTLNVRGVAPLFMRTLVDQMRRCGHEQPVTTMRVRGEEPLRGDGCDVETKTMLKWLERTNTYIDECKRPGFMISQTVAPTTSFSVDLEAAADAVMSDALKQLAMRWLMATAAYVDDDGAPVTRARADLERHLPVFEVYGDKFTARFEQFAHAAVPSRAVLVNLLASARVEGLPIVALNISHPRFTGGEYLAKKTKKKKAPVKKKNPVKKKARAKK